MNDIDFEKIQRQILILCLDYNFEPFILKKKTTKNQIQPTFFYRVHRVTKKINNVKPYRKHGADFLNQVVHQMQ